MTQGRLRDSENPFLLVVPASETHEAGYLRDFKIVRRNQILAEYQLYAVEQWVVDRSKTASTIVASTNDPSHKIVVDVLTPRAETSEARSAIWDRTLLKARTDGARPRQTPLGFILVVSLTSFRSDLSIVLIIGGDLGQAQDALFTNINLRRLGCGGRSGLSLGEPSLSQQDRLLQLYRLPSSGSAAQSFSLVLLSLIRLVQSALSLFNLGPLCSPVNPLREADGLLCDVTIDGLAMWQMEVAEPLIQTELGENVLSPATLAALLSLVISVRCRLLMMNVHAVPSDPFTDPLGFLRVYDSFMRSTKSPYESRYLSAKGIYYLRQQYVRTTKDTLKRAIRNRLDDIRGDSTAAGGVKGAVMEGETTDIASFVATLQASHSNDVESVVALWKGKIRKDTLTSIRKVGLVEYDGNAVPQRIPAVLITDSEDEAGIGSKLLKGVSKRTKKIGDGVSGLLGNKDDTIRAKRHGLLVPHAEDDFSNHASEENDATQRRSPAQSLLSLNFLRSSAASSASESTADEGELAPPIRPTHMRRAASDSNQAPKGEADSPISELSMQLQTRRRRHSLDCMRGIARNGKVMSARRMKVETDLHMSYYRLRVREEQLARLVIALESVYKAYDGALSQIGVRLKARGQTLRDLSERAKELSHGIEAFTSQSDGPSTQRTTSVSSETAYMEREALVSLALGSERLAYAQTLLEEKLNEVQDFDRTLQAKVGGSEALTDRTEEGVKAKVRMEQAGSVVQGLANLLRNSSSGTRKVLEAVGMWSTWLSYLEGRVKSYFR